MGLRTWLVELLAEAQMRAQGRQIADIDVELAPDQVAELLRQANEHLGPPVPEFYNGESWKQWAAEMQHIGVSGWSPCRFANRLGPTDRIGWVFGIVRGEFGVWRSPFEVCVREDVEGGEPRELKLILAAVTHLPTGMGLGLFNAAETACEAVTVIADLEEWRDAPVLGDGEEPNANVRWRELMQKATAAWQFNGIAITPGMHAHQGDHRHEHIAVFRKDASATQPPRESMQ